jgi:hypothetical protein
MAPTGGLYLCNTPFVKQTQLRLMTAFDEQKTSQAAWKKTIFIKYLY